jgi:hypothetical protein
MTLGCQSCSIHTHQKSSTDIGDKLYTYQHAAAGTAPPLEPMSGRTPVLDNQNRSGPNPAWDTNNVSPWKIALATLLPTLVVLGAAWQVIEWDVGELQFRHRARMQQDVRILPHTVLSEHRWLCLPQAVHSVNVRRPDCINRLLT